MDTIPEIMFDNTPSAVFLRAKQNITPRNEHNRMIGANYSRKKKAAIKKQRACSDT